MKIALLRKLRWPVRREDRQPRQPLPEDVTLDLLQQIPRVSRSTDRLPRSRVDGYGQVMERKVQLVTGSQGTRSLRDFGGLYLVHGKYLLEPAVNLQCAYASMVDCTPRSEFNHAIQKAQEKNPGLQVEFTEGDFRDLSVYATLAEVDTSILFEVILHQENYVEVIRQVTAKTRKFVCLGQPCLREDLFPLPCGAVLLQFWDQKLKAVLQRNGFWPEEPMVDRFDTRYWMWGQTTSHLIAVFQGFGWDLEYGEVIDNTCGGFWEFPLLRFRKRASGV